MSDPYLGEIRMFGGAYAPEGWEFCNGKIITIADNEALFALIGTTYGGNGVVNFALPDLRGRLPIHKGARPMGSTYVMGQKGGNETVLIQEAQLPVHTHTAGAQSALGTQAGAGNNANALWADPNGTLEYLPATMADKQMDVRNIAATGGGQPHDNRMPYFPLTFIICLIGFFPTQN